MKLDFKLCKTMPAGSGFEGVPSLWDLGMNDSCSLQAHSACLITCFLCTRKRRAYENRSCVLLPDGLEISGTVDFSGQLSLFQLQTLAVCLFIVSRVKIWHYL